eukprot:gene15597-18530_t
MPLPALLPAAVGTVILVKAVVAALGIATASFLAGHYGGKVLDAITDSVGPATDHAVLFKPDDTAYGLHEGMMRVCLVTKADSWLRKVRIICAWEYEPDLQIQDITVGDKAGWVYTGDSEVKWSSLDFWLREGGTQIELYRDTFWSGWVGCTTIIMDEGYQAGYSGKCLMVYWDDDDGTFFINRNVLYTYNILHDDYARSIHVEDVAASRKLVIPRPPPADKSQPKKPRNIKKEKYGDGVLEKKMDPKLFIKKFVKQVSTLIDKNGDGMIDLPNILDKNGDGKPDFIKPIVVGDKDGDGKPDPVKPVKPVKPVVGDKDGDGKPDPVKPVKPKTTAA